MKNLLSLLLCGVIGCGQSGIKSIVGAVAIDNQPLDQASLVFWPRDSIYLGCMAANATDADGRFTCHPDPKQGQGQPGVYRILVSTESDRAALLAAVFAASKAPHLVRSLPRPKVPLIYGQEQTTPLHAELEAGVNDLQILELSSNPN